VEACAEPAEASLRGDLFFDFRNQSRVKYIQGYRRNTALTEYVMSKNRSEVMKDIQTDKSIVAFSIFLVTLFILAQFIFKHPGSSGPWCFPSLNAPRELGHPMYQFVDYGFPIPILDVLTNDCSEAHPTTYEWLPIGLGVDGLLLVLLAYPLWARFLKKKSKRESKPDIIK
jgi:hypothetical protein